MSLLAFVIFLCWVVPSYQQSDVRITKNLIPPQLEEGMAVLLRCVVRNSQNYPVVTWLKDEELVTNGSDVARNKSVYFIEKSYPEVGKLFYQLNITSVTRMDYGRWTCRAIKGDGSAVSENAVVNVLYVPDKMYPVCEWNFGEDLLTCKTQEGNPRVQVVWSLEANGKVGIRARESAINGIIISKVDLTGLGAPTVDNERMECMSSGRTCSISKEYIYNMTTLSLSVVETENEVRFYCNISHVLSEANLTIYNNNDKVTGNELSPGEDVKILAFQNVKEIEGMTVRCKFQWGILVHKIEEKQLDMRITTQRPPSMTTMTSGDKDSRKDRGDDTDKSKMPDESEKDSSLSPQSRMWLFWLILGIVLLIFIIVLLIYVYRKKKDNPV